MPGHTVRTRPSEVVLILVGITWLVSSNAVLDAWPLPHFGSADRYAHLYNQSLAKPPPRFPETKRPNLLAFAYFSFTIGSSFTASDVEFRSRRIRYTVMTHDVLSFFHNTAILGIAIGVITGI